MAAWSLISMEEIQSASESYRYLFTFTAYPSRPKIYGCPFMGEEVTVHNTVFSNISVGIRKQSAEENNKIYREVEGSRKTTNRFLL